MAVASGREGRRRGADGKDGSKATKGESLQQRQLVADDDGRRRPADARRPAAGDRSHLGSGAERRRSEARQGAGARDGRERAGERVAVVGRPWDGMQEKRVIGCSGRWTLLGRLRCFRHPALVRPSSVGRWDGARA